MRMRETASWLRRFALMLALALAPAAPALADETCQSPFLPKVTGQEDYLYVWTLGMKGVADGNDSIAIRPMTMLCMSWDHRAIDGAYAAQFLTALRRRIETV